MAIAINKIFFVNGPAGTGKTTIANQLALRFENSVVVNSRPLRKYHPKDVYSVGKNSAAVFVYEVTRANGTVEIIGITSGSDSDKYLNSQIGILGRFKCDICVVVSRPNGPVPNDVLLYAHARSTLAKYYTAAPINVGYTLLAKQQNSLQAYHASEVNKILSFIGYAGI